MGVPVAKFQNSKFLLLCCRHPHRSSLPWYNPCDRIALHEGEPCHPVRTGCRTSAFYCRRPTHLELRSRGATAHNPQPTTLWGSYVIAPRAGGDHPVIPSISSKWPPTSIASISYVVTQGFEAQAELPEKPSQADQTLHDLDRGGPNTTNPKPFFRSPSVNYWL